MNASAPKVRSAHLFGLILIVAAVVSGCNRPDAQQTASTTPYAASGGIVAPGPAQADSQPPVVAGSSDDQQTDEPQADAPEGGVAASDAEFGVLTSDSPQTGLTVTNAGQRNDGQGQAASGTPFQLEGSGGSEKLAARALRPDLSPAKLVEFLSGADQDMQLIVSGRSGITNPQEVRDTLMSIIKMKLEASRRLAQHDDATESQKSEGRRGELQSLSHLASIGDVKVAKELEALATSNLESDDANLVSDSRLVLIGFAIESLQNGSEDAPAKIVSFIDQIAKSKNKPDVPAMMVMGQARHSLADYGHHDEAKHVRGVIIDLFANAENPEIAKMAAMFAGNVKNDAMEELRALVMEGKTVSAERWSEAVETLISESPDLQTVQYLAGTALELESVGQQDLAQSTYDALVANFKDPATATGNEVRIAIAAAKARQEVIGSQFDPDLPEIDGSKLSMSDYKGKVVIIPFWAMNFPDSFQVISDLQAIDKAHGDEVAIVGMNLDVEGAPVEQFVQSRDLGFPSFRAESSPTAKVANRVVERFGMVSMPFTAVIDRQGRVAAINFSGRNLDKTVEEILSR